MATDIIIHDKKDNEEIVVIENMKKSVKFLIINKEVINS